METVKEWKILESQNILKDMNEMLGKLLNIPVVTTKKILKTSERAAKNDSP
jgi:hypothetical protein